ncbi:MAG TPA: hypothetical protein VH496_22330 [Mycobacterium sp.]|jgi:hypothetical protein
MTDDLTRWRLNLADDATITFDEATQTITKVSTGETCRLGDYPAFAADGNTLFVTSGHAPKLGKWYVPG